MAIRDEFDDPRPARARLGDAERQLREQLARGEIGQEAYEERMIEIEQAVADFERERALDPEQPPGEPEDAFSEEEPAGE